MKIVLMNVHTSYLYSLLRIRHEIFCLVNLPQGQPWRRWESTMRPKPENYRETDYNDFKAEDYDVLILQTPEHLTLPLAHAKIPKIFIEHNPPDFPPPCYHRITNPDITVVFVSEYVERRWSLASKVKGVAIETGIPDEFYQWKGVEERVLTVVAEFVERAHVTGYNLWRTLTRDLQSKVVGYGNPTLGKAALDFDDLRREYSTNRVYLNTTIAPCMAMREALLTGIPVVTRTEDIPFENEVEIFKSSNLKKMREYVELCLKDYDIAKRVGELGRRKALEVFNISLFVEKWEKLLEEVKS